MNDNIMNAVSGKYKALHDIYKSLAKAYIDDNLDIKDLNEYVKKDHRILSLFDISKFTLDQKKLLIDSNIDSFYEMYKTNDLELFEYVINSDKCYQNILSTILNSLTTDKRFEEGFEFVYKNIDKFDNSWALSNYIGVYPTLYTKDQIELIINANGLKYAEFICEYSNNLLAPDDIINTLSKSVIHHIENDIDYFYYLFEKISLNANGGDFVYIADELKIDFTYEKTLNCIKSIIEKDGDIECVRTLVKICVDNDWLEVFNDAGLDYMRYSTTLYSSNYNLTMSKINDYDEELFVKNILKHITYAKWQDLKRFISFPKYVMIKIRGNK